MTKVRTISGIPDDLWEDAKNEYDTISGGIKDLLEKDLRTDQSENDGKINLLQNSDLTNDQIKLAKDLMTNGSLEKTPAQLGNKTDKYYTDKDYKSTARKKIFRSDVVPIEKQGKGTAPSEIECPGCGSKANLGVLRQVNFDCPSCDKQLYNLDSK